MPAKKAVPAVPAKKAASEVEEYVDPHADNPRVRNVAKIVGAPQADYQPEK